jgi:hypothetical protein
MRLERQLAMSGMGVSTWAICHPSLKSGAASLGVVPLRTGWYRLVPLGTGYIFFSAHKTKGKGSKLNPVCNISPNAALMGHEPGSKAVILRELSLKNDVSLQAHDFSPVANIFHLFSRFFTQFSPVTDWFLAGCGKNTV